MKSAAQRPPRFLWQGVLILLPVAVLAGAGFLSLRQDRALAQLEAREKALALAEQWANLLWAGLKSPASVGEFQEHAFRIDAQDRMVFPPPAASLPLPAPLNHALLSDVQREDWLVSQNFSAPAGEPDIAIAACRRLIESKPPEPFLTATQFRLGHLLAQAGDEGEALRAFRFVAQESPAVMSESGIPLGSLAEFKWLELMARGPSATNAVFAQSLWSFCSNAVSRPTFLTPRLLELAAGIEGKAGSTNITPAWRENWARQDFLRRLAQSALAGRREAGVPELFWFIAPDDSPEPQPLVPPAKVLGGASRSPRPYRNNLLQQFTITNQTALPEPLPPESRQAAWRFFPHPVPVHWLASRVDDGTNGGAWIICRAMEMAASIGRNAVFDSPALLKLRENLPPAPDWADVSVEAGDRILIPGDPAKHVTYLPAAKGGGQSWQQRMVGTPELLAGARRGAGTEPALRVNVRLASPDKLFVRQQTRTRLFGTLIGVAVVAALIGFVSARRAFLRQQQLNEMKSNFVSSVSHELRAPIASVRLMAESLDRGKIVEPAKQREYFRFIVQECRRLGSLIENVLDFSRIEQGRKQYEFEPVDIAALVRQTVKLMEPAAVERNVKLETRLPDLLPSPLTLHSTLPPSSRRW